MEVWLFHDDYGRPEFADRIAEEHLALQGFTFGAGTAGEIRTGLNNYLAPARAPYDLTGFQISRVALSLTARSRVRRGNTDSIVVEPAVAVPRDATARGKRASAADAGDPDRVT